MMQTEPPSHSHSPSPSPPHQLSSPSFSSYSSETFAQIAARVIHQLQNDPLFNLHSDDNNKNTIFHPSWPLNDSHNHQNDDEFEFSFVSRDSNSSPVSADDIFHNGHITPIYPLFGRQISNGAVSLKSSENGQIEKAAVPRRLPLRQLMFEERQTTWSFSSSEDSSSNELEGVEVGTYCVWAPRAPCRKKSTSVGSSSSRPWKLRDLLLSRSHSAGKDPINPKERDQVMRKLFFNSKFN